MNSTASKPPLPIYEALADAAFQSAGIAADEAVIRRTAASLARLAGGMALPPAASGGGDTDFMRALAEVAA